ncbi:hypothetical protein EDD86DRAFT_16213 [Gorgonomyces haynaldii]|nr:hypothetical protein EDD86DRAFT_16213 [Gorgonomyces haynaldii]
MDPQPSQMVNYPGIENSQTLGYSSSQTNSQTLGNPSSQHIGYPASETVVYPSSDRHAYLTSQSNSYPTTFESMERRNVQREINKSMEMDEKPRIIAVMPNVNVHQELLSWSKTHEVYPKAQSLSGSAPLSVSQQATGSTLGTDLSSHVGTNLSPPRRMSYPGNEKQHSWKLVQKQEQEPVIVPTGHADLNQVTTYFSDSDDEDTPEKNSFGKQSRNSVPLLNKPSNMSLLSQGSSVGQPYERPSQFLSTSKSGTFGKDKSSTINQFWRDLYLQQDSKNFDAPPTENSYLTADDHLFHNSVSFDSQVEPLNLSLSLPQDTSQQMGSNADLNLMEDQFKSSTLNLQERGQLDIRQSPIPVEDPNQSLSSVSSRSSVSGPRPPPDHWNTRVTEIEPLQAPSKTSTMKEAFKKAFFRASRKWSQEEEDPPRTSTDTAIYRPQEGPKGPRPMPK